MTLSASQFAYVTKEKTVGDARKKMIYAYCKEKELPVPELDHRFAEDGERDQMKKLDTYPELMEVEILSKHLNLPGLEYAVKDIRDNFLKRVATRQFIVEFPQSEINKKELIPPKIKIPTTLRSIMSDKVAGEVVELWRKRYGHLISTIGEPIKFE